MGIVLHLSVWGRTMIWDDWVPLLSSYIRHVRVFNIICSIYIKCLRARSFFDALTTHAHVWSCMFRIVRILLKTDLVSICESTGKTVVNRFNKYETILETIFYRLWRFLKGLPFWLNSQHVTAVDVFGQRNPKSSVHMAFNPFNLLSHDHVAANWWHGTQLEDTRGLAHVEPRPHAALWALFLAFSGQGFSILRTDRARPEVGGLKTWPVSAKQGTAERCLQSRAPPDIRWFPAFVRQCGPYGPATGCAVLMCAKAETGHDQRDITGLEFKSFPWI